LQRTKWLQSRGYAVIRFWNSDVLNDSDYALGCVLHEIEQQRGGTE